MSAAAAFPAATFPRVAAYGALAVALIIALLHALKPELEPSWRFVSEYAIGRHGWVMQLAFFVWSASCAAMAQALWREVRAIPGKAGVVVLLIVAVALVVAGVFPQDPVTAKPGELTSSGNLHALASMIGIPGIPLAAMLISSSLWRASPTWAPRRTALMTAAHATWISLALMAGYLGWAVPRAGGFTPDVWAGWMNRLVVATYLVWQFTLARWLVADRAFRSSAQ